MPTNVIVGRTVKRKTVRGTHFYVNDKPVPPEAELRIRSARGVWISHNQHVVLILEIK